ncbi:hypothetical protein [Streptomyces alfalfae]
MTEKMVDPAGIPQFTGNLEQLAKDASGLRSAATGIRSGGADVHSRFQMLGAYYIAPEAEDLFSTTEPVMDKADTFAADLETVADALDTFASEVRPLAAKLVSLQEDARKFVASVEGDNDWTDDGDKTARNNELVADVTATRAAFEAAERRAASKISALVGGPRFIEDDGSHKATEQTVMYGYDADLLKQAKDLPWGSPVSQTRPDNLGGHLTSFFYDGFVMNGAVASVKGLGTLVGIGGSAKDAWKGLYDVSAGAGHYLMKPTDWVLDQTMFATEDTADMKRQKTAFREFGKAFVAWDQWEEHPVQAAGTVTFNALTLAAGPLGAVAKGGSAAGKVGLGAKAAGIGAKIGTYADPFSAALTVGGKAVGKLPTVAEVTARISPRVEATPEFQRVHSVLEIGGHRVRIEDGKFNRIDTEGRPIKDSAPSDRTVGSQPHHRETSLIPQREPALIGPDARGPQASHGLPHNSGAGAGSGHGGHEDAGGPGSASAESAEGARHSTMHPGGQGDPGATTDGGGVLGSGRSNGGNAEDYRPPPVKEWPAGDDVTGAARGLTLLYPNDRHQLSGVRHGVAKERNTIILPDFKEAVREDIAAIAAGRADWDAETQRYRIRGRSYAVEPHGRIFPAGGPGFLELSRHEYSALKHIMRANGDMSKVETVFSKAPQFRDNPQAVTKALALYRKYYP